MPFFIIIPLGAMQFGSRLNLVQLFDFQNNVLDKKENLNKHSFIFQSIIGNSACK